MAIDSGKDVAQQVEHVSSGASIRSEDTSHNKDAAADLLQAQQIAAQWAEGSLEEKKLVRKLDWRILPCAWILYLLGYLDRSVSQVLGDNRSLHTNSWSMRHVVGRFTNTYRDADLTSGKRK